MFIDAFEQAGFVFAPSNVWVNNGGQWALGLQDILINYVDKVRDLPLAIEIETDKGEHKKIGVIHASLQCCNDSKYHWANIGRTPEIDLLWSRDFFQARNFLPMKVTGVDYCCCGHSPVGSPKRFGNIFFLDTGACFDMYPITIIPVENLYNTDFYTDNGMK